MVPDAQVLNRALATGEGSGKGNEEAGKPKTQRLSSIGIWFQEAHVVPISIPSPRKSLAAFIVLSLSRAFPEIRQPLHLLEQKLKIGSDYRQSIDSDLEACFYSATFHCGVGATVSLEMRSCAKKRQCCSGLLCPKVLTPQGGTPKSLGLTCS